MSTRHMALLSQPVDYQFRPTNKEPEWSSICNDVFDQYLDSDALFGLGGPNYERSSSNDSATLFDFSASSGQSHRTDTTSPLPVWEPNTLHSQIEAKQPKAQEPPDFWQRTLQALERNAAECESRQRRLRTSKSHPDFLSLGGNPSPPDIPSSPTDHQSFLLREKRLPRSAANGKRRNFTSRSLSRGRPTGVSKTAAPVSVNPHATLRTHDPSPAKTMNQPRYQAGFKDLWAEKLHRSPKKYALQVPYSVLPASPPPSAKAPYADEFSALRSAAIHQPMPDCDEHISPLTNTFQRTHIHTPIASPTINYAAYAQNSSFEPLPSLPLSAFSPSMVPLNDTAPMYPERTSLYAPNRIASFDFGFANSAPTDTAWTVAARSGQMADPFDSFHGAIFPSTETCEFTPGLGTTCESTLLSGYNTPLDTITLPVMTYATSQPSPTSPYYPSTHLGGLPTTPIRRSRGRHRSPSPSPPATESRVAARKRSSSRRATSRHHRRTKSTGTTSTPRHPATTDKASGFVNFTPDDSCKILNGVAPSGSSKTKARREKEAADKRRRLSQAAIRAVVAAGGDMDALSEAGLLI